LIYNTRFKLLGYEGSVWKELKTDIISSGLIIYEDNLIKKKIKVEKTISSFKHHKKKVVTDYSKILTFYI